MRYFFGMHDWISIVVWLRTPYVHYEGTYLKTRIHYKCMCTKEKICDEAISQWFPDKRGIVGSIVIAGSGYGPAIWIPLQTLYVNPDNVAAVEAEGEIDRYVYFFT